VLQFQLESPVEDKYYGHAHVIYHEPVSRSWRPYHQQLSGRMYYGKPRLQYYVFFKSPVIQSGSFLCLLAEANAARDP